jgi:hypothetical protein
VLLTRGRLSLPQLVRYAALKSRTVRAAVLVLVQHNILWHATTEEEGEVLEFNIDECLMRLRFGRFVWQAEKLFGEAVRHSSFFSHFNFFAHSLLGRRDCTAYTRSRQASSARYYLAIASVGLSIRCSLPSAV